MEHDCAGVPFVKGHGTGNDFVVLPDPDANLELTAELIERLCSRHTGIGADGILRVVRSAVVADGRGEATWFMDYRNADGSIAQMCGNGARVFARFLIEEALEAQDFTIETRAGVHRVRQLDDGNICVEMGKPTLGPTGADPVVSVAGAQWSGDAWWLPNPHAVVFVDDLDESGTLFDAPKVAAGDRFLDGQNVEFVVDASAGSILAAQMRVYERGVGETLSCGTGACAVALSVRKRHAVTGPGRVEVSVPGGALTVEFDSDDVIWLAGPAEIIGRGTIAHAFWEGEQ